MEFAINYTALAPTENGWQPWYFRLADTHVELMTKINPAQEAADPDRRGFMIGCGSALQYLKVALKYFGCLGQVILFPDLGQTALVARINFGSGCAQEPQEKRLFKAMPAGPAAVSPLGEMPVSDAMLTVLANTAAGERCWLDFVQSETGRQQVLEATLTDDHDLGFGDEADEPEFPPAVTTALFAVVKTKTDDKHGWLEAGQTMARIILQAQAMGVSWAFFDPVRRRAVREELRTGVGRKGFAQVILRFGPLMTDEMVQPAEPEISWPQADDFRNPSIYPTRRGAR